MRTILTTWKAPTLEELLRHFEKLGPADQPRDGLNRPVEHKSYAQLSKDILVQVAFDYLSQDEYAMFVAKVGRPEWASLAAEDWAQDRADSSLDPTPENGG